jgi:hypothetical protein
MFLFRSLLANFIFLSLNSFGAHYDPNPEEVAGYRYQALRPQNLDNFADEDVIVIYRGIHFLPANFGDAERIEFIQGNQVNEPMYASATYQQAGEIYGSTEYETLDLCGQEISALVNVLDNTGECEVAGQLFTCARYPFHELYSNDATKFLAELAFPSADRNIMFDDMDFTANPLLSCSDRVRHPGKYGFGLKNYGVNQPLLPLYDINGRPRHPILGKLYALVLDAAAIEELKPMNVAEAHRRGFLRLQSHFRKDILSEREISIAGYIPAECVVFEMPLQVPSFAGNYPQYYERKYGLTKTRYNNFKAIFTNAATTPTRRMEKSQELMNGIIKASYEDNKLIYKNCIAKRIPALFEEELGNLDARIGTLNLDYEID